jgi:hypothetical protein
MQLSMKKTILLLISCCTLASLYGQGGIEFISSDFSLQTAFGRAKEMALHYKGMPDDPVGPWYESALPPRSAFCMRDISPKVLAAKYWD